MKDSSIYKKVYGCLIGGLIGDAMGAPVETKHYKEIEKEYGQVDDFEGDGTDDSAIKLILCEAILSNNGYITADEFAEAFLNNNQYYNLFYIPVRNMVHKLKSSVVLPVNAGMGNMQSSSSAMSISPMGLINACNQDRLRWKPMMWPGLYIQAIPISAVMRPVRWQRQWQKQ